jgi:uncharacterized protein YmfQ (DUF2313 family)
MSDREAIRAALNALLPTGPALPRDPGTPFQALLGALAGELGTVLGRARALRDEADPRAADELLADWERVAGLPDPCLGQAPTVAQRRARLVQQLTQGRGQSPGFFVGLAATLGRSATVAEFAEHDCEQDCETGVHDTAWRFAWRMTLPIGSAEVFEATCEDGCETPLAQWGDTVVECVVGALKPAHTILQFAYA